MSNVCGTGDGNHPKPGDPNSNINIWAAGVFGGIDVGWSYPTINPHAVAHSILYRSTSDDVNTAATIAVVNGSTYYDKTVGLSSTRYYYWIQVVSVNGTYGPMQGPATAIARPTIEDIMRDLTSMIDEGVLAESLKDKIALIELNSLKITQEMIDRAREDDELGVAFNEVMAFSKDTRAVLQTEVLARTTADSALVDSINTLYSTVGDTVAAVQTVQQAQATRIESIAKSVTTTEATLNGNSTSGQVGLVSKVTTAEGKITEIGTLYTAKVQTNGLIGGFGVYNDGKTVQAGFDVDTFWIGRTANDKIKPFIVQGDEVFIKEAVIKSLTFNKLRSDTGALTFVNDKLQAKYIAVDQLVIQNANIKGDLKSDNYVQGVSGWILKK